MITEIAQIDVKSGMEQEVYVGVSSLSRHRQRRSHFHFRVRSDKTHVAQNESDSDRRHVGGHPFLSLRASLRTYEPQQTPTITQ